jgi:hypothetical protein
MVSISKVLIQFVYAVILRPFLHRRAGGEQVYAPVAKPKISWFGANDESILSTLDRYLEQT